MAHDHADGPAVRQLLRDNERDVEDGHEHVRQSLVRKEEVCYTAHARLAHHDITHAEVSHEGRYEQQRVQYDEHGA